MFVDICNTQNKYEVIYADPPWQYGSKKFGTGYKDKWEELDVAQYPTMSHQELVELPIKQISSDNSICFMWVTDSHLKEGIALMEAWGFKYTTIGFNWIKKTSTGGTCKNFAPWTLKSWEICIIGTKGTCTKLKTSNNVIGLIEAERRKHSQKPEEARERINQLFANSPKLELFAREIAEGWDCWGNDPNIGAPQSHSTLVTDAVTSAGADPVISTTPADPNAASIVSSLKSKFAGL